MMDSHRWHHVSPCPSFPGVDGVMTSLPASLVLPVSRARGDAGRENSMKLLNLTCPLALPVGTQGIHERQSERQAQETPACVYTTALHMAPEWRGAGTLALNDKKCKHDLESSCQGAGRIKKWCLFPLFSKQRETLSQTLKDILRQNRCKHGCICNFSYVFLFVCLFFSVASFYFVVIGVAVTSLCLRSPKPSMQKPSPCIIQRGWKNLQRCQMYLEGSGSNLQPGCYLLAKW